MWNREVERDTQADRQRGRFERWDPGAPPGFGPLIEPHG